MLRYKSVKVFILVGILLLIGVVLCVYSWHTNNKMSFKSKTLTLYQIKLNNLEKICDIDEESVVENIETICSSYNFAETQSANMGFEYVLVFNDTKEVICFSNFDVSYGSIGKNFDLSYVGKHFNNVYDMYDPVLRISSIPLELLNILKDFSSK